ncbi:sepiapterin reductase-like [Hydra vulgaris]|uniref:Sepiapterin reductase-like n=1 Tax=Hydra vulgaris TaxID=6087 RepID=A0ABM4CZI3_HYDVU
MSESKVSGNEPNEKKPTDVKIMDRRGSINSSNTIGDGISKPSFNWSQLRKKSFSKIRLIKGKFLVIVTGAGHGLGRSIAGLAFQDQGIFAQAFSGSKVIMVDKDMDALNETSGKKMRQFLKHRKIDVVLECIDLMNLTDTKNFLNDLVAKNDQDYEHIVFVNNTSTLGNISQTLMENENLEELEDYWRLNITSRIYLTTQICKLFPFSKKTVVHTARTESTTASEYMGLSNIATSAFDMFGQTFAKENPTIRVLYFTPNLLDTKRCRKIVEECPNKDLCESIQQSIDQGTLETPLDAAKKMSRILEEYEFTQGEVLRINLKNNNIEIKNNNIENDS